MNQEHVPTAKSEDSDEVRKHPQEFSSEGEAHVTTQEEGCSLQGAVHARIAHVCTLVRQEEPWRSV